MKLFLALLLPIFATLSSAADPVADAAPLLALIHEKTSIILREGVPPKGVAGHEAAMLDPEVTKTGDYFFHAGEPLFGQMKKQIGEMILAKEVLAPSSGEEKRGDFHPDYAIRWNYIDEMDFSNLYEAKAYEEEMKGREEPSPTVPVDLLICFTSGEAILRQGDKSLRYDLGKATLEHFKKTLPIAGEESSKEERAATKEFQRRRKPPVELTEEFREALRQGAAMEIHEGLPHPYHRPKVLAAEMKREDVGKIGGHAFYTPARDVSENAGLRKILGDATMVEQRSDGMKMCGGFHPDYAVGWESGGQPVYCLVCFGCGEITYLSGGKGMRYDMGELRKPLVEILKTFRLKCPQPREGE